MKPYVVKMPRFVQRLYPKRIWAFPNEHTGVYLTFDDGPIPEVTPWVLETLKEYSAKATFFCIGDNVKKHPDIFQRIYAEGHAIGNHTNNHLKGSRTKANDYVENVLKAEEVMKRWVVGGKRHEAESTKHEEEISNRTSNIVPRKSIFRPPFGKITMRQASLLQNKGFKIVMWDVLSADFDASISEEKCLQNVLGAIAPGSIVVFHDSLKAEKNLRYTLPKVLEYISEKGWKCEPIDG